MYSADELVLQGGGGEVQNLDPARILAISQKGNIDAKPTAHFTALM